MHEIIFRGKRKENGEWAYGDLYHAWSWIYTKPDIKIANNIGKFPVIPETVGQYTGLADKNGKKIFEGDIVTFGQNVYQINFECGSFSLLDSEGRMITKIGGINDYCYSFQRLYDECMWEDGWAYDIEIIGNIHDNPELLEK